MPDDREYELDELLERVRLQHGDDIAELVARDIASPARPPRRPPPRTVGKPIAAHTIDRR